MGRFSLDGYTDKCIRVLNDMVNPKYVKADKQIPATLIRHCEGIAFITIFKAGLFFLGGNIGGGCVIAKVKDESEPRGWRWSGPASVTCGGLGGGFIFGGEKIDSIIILNTKSSVRAFMGDGQVTFGGNLSLAAGPVGRDIEGHLGVSKNKEIVAAYSYSKAQGIYIGATLEGAFLVSKNSDNQKYYGDTSVTAERILAGEVRAPLKVDTLHRELYAIHDRKGDYKGLESSHSQMNVGAASNPTTSSAPGSALGPVPEGSAAGQPKLLPNWRTVFTDDGKKYYHNTVTNETAWEAPLAPAPPAASSSMPSSVPPPAPSSSSSSSPVQHASTIPHPVTYPMAQAIPEPAKSNPFQQQSQPLSTTASPSYPAIPQGRPAPPVRPPAVPSPATTTPTAVALYDYTATRPDELSFKANDSLQIIDKSDPNWFKCSLNGKQGMAPSNYLKQ